MRRIVFCLFTLPAIASFGQKGETTSPDLNNTVTKKETADTNSIYDLVNVEVIPSYPGGDTALMHFLSKNIAYPDLAKEMGVEGKVFITFVVSKRGDVTNVELYKGARRTPIKKTNTATADTLNKQQLSMYEAGAIQLDKEALRVVKMLPQWSPGLLSGVPVNVRFILPISYKLQ